MCIQNGAVFLATNYDHNTASGSYPGFMVPGNGAFVKAIETASDKKATITGKPNPKVMDLISSNHSISKSSVLFIGDNLFTDIKFSNNSGVDCLLVLTGVTDRELLEKKGNEEEAGKPTYIKDDLAL